jgi:tripartite-type tricarboxylate transporter receptor subunit TctC
MNNAHHANARKLGSIGRAQTCADFGMQRRMLLGALATLPFAARAQTWPERPVRVIVPFPAGGSLDIIPRLVTQQMGGLLGQPFVVENRVGASGRLAVEAARAAAPDGHVLMAINGVTHGSNPAVTSNLGYDPIHDLAPIVLLAQAPLAVLVQKDVPANTLAELVALMRREPGKLNFASGGAGTQLHLAAVMLLAQSGLPADAAVHVPYAGQAPAVTDLLAGRVQFMVTSTGSVMQQIRAGGLRALATTGRERWFRLPDVPTLQELGYAEFDVVAWAGLAAPARTPQPILDRLNEAANRALADAELRTRLEGVDFRAAGGSIGQMRDFVAAEVARYRKVVRDAGLTFDN